MDLAEQPCRKTAKPPRPAGAAIIASSGISAADDDPGVAQAVFLRQAEEDRRVFRMQTDAAMRGRPAEALDFISGMHRIAAVEEDRVRHRRIVVFARAMIARSKIGAPGAGRRYKALARGGDFPFVFLPAILGHRH